MRTIALAAPVMHAKASTKTTPPKQTAPMPAKSKSKAKAAAHPAAKHGAAAAKHGAKLVHKGAKK